MRRKMRDNRKADEARGGGTRGDLDDPIAEDVDAGAASVQPEGPHLPAAK